MKRQVLNSGDAVRFGDIEFQIQRTAEAWELEELRDLSLKRDTESIVQEQLAALDVQQRLPSKKFLTVVCVLVTLGIGFILPLSSSKKTVWSSGKITSHHGMLSSNCSSCHAAAFAGVNDGTCANCHLVSSHVSADTAKLSGFVDPQAKCIECHREHEDISALVPTEVALCTSCHAQVNSIASHSVLQSVASWETHPEFSVSVRADDTTVQNLSLSDKANLIDPGHLKLNHALHLRRGLRGKDGPTDLQCRDCHAVSEEGTGVRVVSMDKNCRSCHSLGFDERLPNREVPHASADEVYRALYGEYAKLLLAPEGTALPAGFDRARPGQVVRNESERQSFIRGTVEKEARAAEEQLFTKTACFLCHDVGERSESLALLNVNQVSRYVIKPVNITRDWMPAARYKHQAHEAIQCADCHHGVYESRATRDVLMPGMATCRECHHGAETGSAQSTCITCHSYHESEVLPMSRKRSIEELVKELRP